MENMRAKIKAEGGKLEQGKGPQPKHPRHSGAKLKRGHRIKKHTKKMRRA
jgi:hypothetical protein